MTIFVPTAVPLAGRRPVGGLQVVVATNGRRWRQRRRTNERSSSSELPRGQKFAWAS